MGRPQGRNTYLHADQTELYAWLGCGVGGCGECSQFQVVSTTSSHVHIWIQLPMDDVRYISDRYVIKSYAIPTCISSLRNV